MSCCSTEDMLAECGTVYEEGSGGSGARAGSSASGTAVVENELVRTCDTEARQCGYNADDAARRANLQSGVIIIITQHNSNRETRSTDWDI